MCIEYYYWCCPTAQCNYLHIGFFMKIIRIIIIYTILYNMCSSYYRVPSNLTTRAVITHKNSALFYPVVMCISSADNYSTLHTES